MNKVNKFYQLERMSRLLFVTIMVISLTGLVILALATRYLEHSYYLFEILAAVDIALVFWRYRVENRIDTLMQELTDDEWNYIGVAGGEAPRSLD